MSYEKKVQLNLNNSIYQTSKLNASNGVDKSSDVASSQTANQVANNLVAEDREYIDVNLDENTNAEISNSENSDVSGADENEVLIKQLEAEISKLQLEYEANQSGKGIAGNIGGFFSSCKNAVTGKGFKDTAKAELDEKIALLNSAKSDPTKLQEAYSAIMGADLTDEVCASALEAQNIADGLSDEEKQAIVDTLKEQASSLKQLMEESKDNQGWFSKAMGGINNVFGFGTNSIKADAKIEDFINQVNSLNPDDPDFAQKYQALTGEALTLDGIEELSQGVSKVGNSQAAEAVMDYEETQDSLKEVGAGIVSSLAVAACVIAAPVTGGLSIALGAAVGGAANVLIKGTDTIGTDEKYSLEQGILDFGGGAINGTVTAMTLGSANLAGKGFSALKGSGSAVARKTAEQTVSGGFKNAAKTAFTGFGKSSLYGAKIAAFSTTSNYMLNTVGTNALYEATGNYAKSETPSNIAQNEDGTYSVYYELSDSNTGKVITYEIETVDSLFQDENGNLVKGNVISTSRANDFNFGDLAKQNAVSVGSAMVGSGIGKITGNIINPYATTMTNSLALGNAFEIAADMSLSLGADYLIESARAGQFVDKDEFFSWDRILGEGRNQIRGLLIGIATSKANNYGAVADDALGEGVSGKTLDMADIPTKTGADVKLDMVDSASAKAVDEVDSVGAKVAGEVDAVSAKVVPDGANEAGAKVAGGADGAEIKLGDSPLPKTQQQILETAGRLILEENNPAKAGELLSSCGMKDSEIETFFEEIIKAKQETARIAAIQTPQNGTVRCADDLSIEDISTLYNSRMNVISEDDAANMLSKYTTKSDEKLARIILNNMGQYADLDGFNSLYKQLNNSEITLVTEKNNTSLCDILSYLSDKKAFPKDITIQADNIKSGIEKLLQNNKTPGLILDTPTIAAIKNDADLQELIRLNSDIKLILPDGYNKGVTAFNHSSLADVEQKLNILHAETKELLAKGYSEQEAINKVLNGDILNDFEQLNLSANIQIIKNAASQSALSDVELSYLYSLKQISSEQLEEILSNYSVEDRQYVLEILAQTSKPFSMSTLSAQTKKQFVNIQNIAEQKGIGTDNIYYLVPTVELGSGKKSYGMVSTIFRDSNNLPASKFVSDISQIPNVENSMVVILDDFSGSGKSLIDNYRAITNPEEVIREQLEKQAKKQVEKGTLTEAKKVAWIETKTQEELLKKSSDLIPYNSNLQKFNGEILIAPLASTTGEGSAIVNFAKYTESDLKLTFMPSDEIPLFLSSDYMKSLSINDQRTFQQILKPFDSYVRFDPTGDKASKWKSPNDESGYFGFRGNATSIAFPYMAPSNNNAFYSTFIAPMLTFNSAGIKNRWIVDLPTKLTEYDSGVLVKTNAIEGPKMTTKNDSGSLNLNGNPIIKTYANGGQNSNGEKVECNQEVKYNYGIDCKSNGSEVVLKVDGKNIESYKVADCKEVEELTTVQKEQIEQVYKHYAQTISEELNLKFDGAYQEFLSIFGDMAVDVNPMKKNNEDTSKVSGNIMYGRAKGLESLRDKIVNKIASGDKNVANINDARKIVEDGIGTRLILDEINDENMQALTNKLCSEIENGNIQITEINNYRGKGLPPYFTDAQIEQIKNAVMIRRNNDRDNNCYDETLKDLKVITGSHEKAVKASGYSALQLNVKYKNGALGEIQIRGKEMDQVAEVEHVPYDIRKGKQLKPKYDNIAKEIKALDDDTYGEYQKYWQGMFEYAIKKERGIPCARPELPDGVPKSLAFEELQKI